MPATHYVRVIVVQTSDVLKYKHLVARLGQADTLPCTLIMELPGTLDLKPLKPLAGLAEAYLSAVPSGTLSVDSGAGYARLCIQLVAHALQLHDVWMLDDSIQDCWQLNLHAESLKKQPPEHGPLDPCSFFTVMSSIEQHVAATRQPIASADAEPLFSVGQRTWDPAVSTRAAASAQGQTGEIKDAYDFSGSHSNVGIIGLNRQPYRHKLVGATWDQGRRRRPDPFKITHSVYCFFLLNVQATCSKSPKVLWPARQYAEDIEMHHLCEDNQLAVLKVNSLFFHKANLQGPAAQKAKEGLPHKLPQGVSMSPEVGPMWCSQQVTVTVRHAQNCTAVTVCGVPAAEAGSATEGERAYTARLHAVYSTLTACVTAPDERNVVLSGCVSLKIGHPEPFTVSSVFGYQGLWRWGDRTHVRARVPSDTGRLERHSAPPLLCKVTCCAQGNVYCGVSITHNLNQVWSA